MKNDTPSLRDQNATARLPLIVIGLAFALLVSGMIVPVMKFESLFDDEASSVLSAIWDLALTGSLGLGLLIFLFSIVFPFAKLIGLLVIWFKPLPQSDRSRSIFWLLALGKWSMLDVFVIVVMMGAVQLGLLAEAKALPGIYLFGTGILLSMVATILVGNYARKTRS